MTFPKFAVPRYMYQEDYYPPFAHGAGYLVPLNRTPCLFQKGLDTRYLFMDDAFVTGLVRKKCGMEARNENRISPDNKRICGIRKRDLVIHYVGPDSMYNVHKFMTENFELECMNKR